MLCEEARGVAQSPNPEGNFEDSRNPVGGTKGVGSGRVLRAFGPRQASPHKGQLPRQALVSEKPGEGRIWQPSSLGVRGKWRE